MNRKGIFVTGTDTDVGKTWVGQSLIAGLAACGLSVIPRKPAESGWPIDVTESDAWKLANAAKVTDQLDLVCPHRFQAAISPVRAAALEHVSLTVNQLKTACLNIADDEFLYVEGAGGFYSPLVSDGLNADLAEALHLPIVLIANDRLGIINQVLLSQEAITGRGLELRCVILNETSPKHEVDSMDNLADLRNLLDVPVFSFGYQQQEVSHEWLSVISD
ncbi:MAG: Dethiobiotin synthetase (EC [uncultured Thiotrichaceae bacterium]|uniref:ATP-dependent dethiobiotin synthetase BioD n=1 Tax=uncultured Thiotrichaceae bacterium TaxID=298394 RepID=A0A6S6T2F4_9GAMM|nr:MAG: Dethiobiotin synthetase (EC [uncultured Thiotrichaceae bacterium]